MPSGEGLMGSSTAMAVVDASQVVALRQAVAALCRSAGLDESEGGRASIVATEAATNVVIPVSASVTRRKSRRLCMVVTPLIP